MKSSKRKVCDEGIDNELDDKEKKLKKSNNNKNSTLLCGYLEDESFKEKFSDSVR